MNMKHIARQFFDPRYMSVERRAHLIMACILFWSIILYLLISTFILGTSHIVGESMQPTLIDNQEVIMHCWPYFFRDPKRGEIAVLQEDDGLYTVKRIIALPGDIIQIKNGYVYLNGSIIIEPYVRKGMRTPTGPIHTRTLQILEDYYFVLGDNREDSIDSRFFGPVHRDQFSGMIYD